MRISFDTPAYFITSVTHKRLPVFRTQELKYILAKALDEARTSANILYFAYAIMPDHLHIITDSVRKPSETLRYINGLTARRVIDHLKAHGHRSSLDKLRQEAKKGDHRYSLWEHHSDKFLITSEAKMIQKANYIHWNPAEAGLCQRPEEYLWSSFRQWNKNPVDDEPLLMDLRDIEWRLS